MDTKITTHANKCFVTVLAIAKNRHKAQPLVASLTDRPNRKKQ